MSFAISYSVNMAGLSKETVAKFFEPPRKNTIAARAYKGLADAHVAPKRNNLRNTFIRQMCVSIDTVELFEGLHAHVCVTFMFL